MSPIGGFLPLELASAAEPYHPDAAALTSGRASWHLILRTCRPARVLVPFYVCDAVLEPLAATRTPYVFYPIAGSFRPEPGQEPAPGELLLVVNYFGAMASAVAAIDRALPGRVVVDDTQAFFRRGRPDAWSFNSARKFFGVPDGAFLYGPARDARVLPPSDIADCDHLLTRLAGDDEIAWEQFKRHEARVGVEPRAMSMVTMRLLGAVDMQRTRRRRQANFEALHGRLGAMNTIELPLDDVAGEGPLCYPFLPGVDVDRARLAAQGVFVPTFWPEIAHRIAPGFERERLFARRLLPLPIDQRYGPDDMARVCQVLQQVLR
jgi:hypothetical protein